MALLSTSGHIFKYRCVLILGQKMVDCKSELVNTKFLVKMKKFTMETFQLLTESYSKDCMSCACVFEWHKQFSEGRESLKDDDLPGRSHTAVTDDNIEKEHNLIQKDWRLGVRAGAEKVNLDRESVQWIPRGNWTWERFVQKWFQSAVMWNKRTSQGTVFWPFVTHWEWTRFVEFDNYLWWNLDICIRSRNQASMQWKSTSSPRPKKACMSYSKFMAMLIVFFDIQGTVMAEWVPSGQTVNQ